MQAGPDVVANAGTEAAPEGEGDGPRRVAIIAGGLGHERDISIRSGRRSAQVLRDQGFEVTVWDLDQNLTQKLLEWQPDVVWPLVHGSHGEDGSLQDFVSLLGFPCVGADGSGARLASHKATAKALVANAGLATPSWITLSQALFRQVGAPHILGAVLDGIGLPLVVKPADGGSALGVTVVRDAADLPAAMVSCFAYSQEALVEHFVAGTEVSASVVALDGPGSARALQLVEVDSDGGYDFDARYNPGRAEFFVPARLDAETAARVSRTAEHVHTLFGLGEFSRTDFIVDPDGTPWVLDINVAPGMTETSLFPQAAAQAGPEIYAAIVRAAAGAAEDAGSEAEDDAAFAAGVAGVAGATGWPLAARGPVVGVAASVDDDARKRPLGILGGGGSAPLNVDALVSEMLAEEPHVIVDPEVVRGADMPDTELEACSNCGAHKTHKLLWGLPGADAQALAEREPVIFAGCLVPGAPPWPDRQCVQCGRRWRSGEPEVAGGSGGADASGRAGEGTDGE
nr:ATP-grasp domain-containing protein [Actinomycetales bacterium]